MTIGARTPSPSEKPGLIRKSRGFFLLLSAVVGVAAVAAWAALGVGFWLDVGRSTRLILVIVAAVATEALFWSVAAALGLSVLDARKRIWRWMTGRG